MSLKHKTEGYADLLRHYREVFRLHWKNRLEMDGGLFNEQEAEFLPSALSLQEKPVSPAARLLGKALMAMVGILFVWSFLGKVDIIVNATGKVVPSTRTKVIASVDVASVKALHVEEGQVVKAGDLLIELDASASDTERDKAVGESTMSTLQAARSRALITAVDSFKTPQLPQIAGVPDDKWQAAQQHLSSQYMDFLAKLRRIDGDIQRYNQTLPLAAQRASDYKDLAKDHDVSLHAYLEKEQARADLEGQLFEAKNQRTALIAETKRQAYDLLTEGSKAAAISQQDALKANSHSKLLRLTAPVDGTVQQLMVHTVGGVVPAAQPLMLIVPKEELVEIEAVLENKDVGFVEEGQSAEVKIDAFEYTKYGTIPAHVTHVSRDAIQDDKKVLTYLAKIILAKPSIAVNGRDMPLSAGMTVNVEIKTGTRRVIEYVLSPLIQHERESFNER
jgi:hemolysin D